MKPHLQFLPPTDYPPIITVQLKYSMALYNKITALSKAKGWSPREVIDHAISLIYHDYEIERIEQAKLFMEKRTDSIES